MKAVIMAGGKGTRLASVLKEIPKPMALIDGKPILEHQIAILSQSNINEIIIVVGHLKETIISYFGDGSKFGTHIEYVMEEQPLGTGGGLSLLKGSIQDTFVLIFGDIFLDVDFERFTAYHRQKKSDATLFAHPNSHPKDSDLVVTDQHNLVVGWDSKHNVRDYAYGNLVNAGLYVLEPCVFDYVPYMQKTDFEHDVLLKMIQERPIYAYRSTEYAKDIGTPERMEQVSKDYLAGFCSKRNLRSPQKCVFLDRDGTINQYAGLIKNPNELVLEEGAALAIRKLNNSEYLTIVVTNQPVIARGECTFDGMAEIHKRLEMLLSDHGAYVDAILFCPHHPHSGYEGEIKELKVQCECRKPGTLLLTEAAQRYHIDLTQSWFVGDTTMDIQTGVNAGTKTALVLTGMKGQDLKYQVKSDIICDSLSTFVDELLNNE